MEEDGVTPPNASVYDQDVPGGHFGTDEADGQKGQETNEVFEETTAIDCDEDKAGVPKAPGEDEWFMVYGSNLSRSLSVFSNTMFGRLTRNYILPPTYWQCTFTGNPEQQLPLAQPHLRSFPLLLVESGPE